MGLLYRARRIAVAQGTLAAIPPLPSTSRAALHRRGRPQVASPFASRAGTSWASRHRTGRADSAAIAQAEKAAPPSASRAATTQAALDCTGRVGRAAITQTEQVAPPSRPGCTRP